MAPHALSSPSLQHRSAMWRRSDSRSIILGCSLFIFEAGKMGGRSYRSRSACPSPILLLPARPVQPSAGHGAAAGGLNQMKTEADFQGREKFDVRVDAEANDSKQQVALYQEYAGRYNIRRNVDVSGAARYNLPHITVTKSGKLATTAGSLVDYTITVTNDGNRALGPVYVQDVFPPGSEYVYSSMRPSAQNASSARWTLL